MIIATTDGTYSYTITEGSSAKYAVPVFKLVNNKRISNTNGFQIKTQYGRNRIECELELIDSDTNIRASLVPILEYPTELEVTFDDLVPFRNNTKLTMALIDYDLDSKFQYVDNNNVGDLQVTLKLVEVIGV